MLVWDDLEYDSLVWVTFVWNTILLSFSLTECFSEQFWMWGMAYGSLDSLIKRLLFAEKFIIGTNASYIFVTNASYSIVFIHLFLFQRKSELKN